MTDVRRKPIEGFAGAASFAEQKAWIEGQRAYHALCTRNPEDYGTAVDTLRWAAQYCPVAAQRYATLSCVYATFMDRDDPDREAALRVAQHACLVAIPALEQRIVDVEGCGFERDVVELTMHHRAAISLLKMIRTLLSGIEEEKPAPRCH